LAADPQSLACPQSLAYPQLAADPQSLACPQSLADPQSATHNRGRTRNRSVLEILARRGTVRHEFSYFFMANGPSPGENDQHVAIAGAPPIAGGRLRVCQRLRVKKFSIFFRAPRDPRLASLDAAQRGSLRSPREPGGSPLPLYTIHPVRV
jgi:hypothetical protein